MYFAVCTADKFDCGNGKCLEMSLLCNYFDNCGDKEVSDEKNCSYPEGEHYVNTFEGLRLRLKVK